MAYYINQNGDNYGPYTIGQLRSMWSAGQVTGETLYCEEGSTEWLRLSILAEVFDAENGSPPPLLAARAGVRRPFVAGGIVLVVFIVIPIVAILLSLLRKPAVIEPTTAQNASVQQTSSQGSQRSSRKIAVDSQTVSAEYAARINAFASKWDMTVEAVIRRDYILTKRGLTLADLDEFFAKIEKSRGEALGYHPNIPKHNANGRRLVVGETQFLQNPVLTEDEEGVVKVLKLAGY